MLALIGKITNVNKIYNIINKNHLSLLALLCIPLIYIPNNYTAISTLRALALFGISTGILFYNHVEIVNDFKRFNKVRAQFKTIFLIVLLVVLGSLIKSSQPISEILLGTPPVYLGILSWLCFVVLAVTNRKTFTRHISSSSAITIFTIILSFSILIDFDNIWHGIRISGLLVQSTTLAMYAVLVIVIIFYKLINKNTENKLLLLHYITLILAIIILLLTQSRIGYLSLLISLGLITLKFNIKSKKILLCVLTIVVLLPLLAITQKNYFYRFQANRINQGSSYRSSMYYLSLLDVSKNNIVFGNGPGSLPVSINDINQVPADLADTLNQSIVFSSTHNLFLDMAYYFGLIFSFLLFAIALFGIILGLLSRDPETGVLSIIVLILFLNAVFNVPSIELTSLFFISLASLIYKLPVNYKLKTRLSY